MGERACPLPLPRSGRVTFSFDDRRQKAAASEGLEVKPRKCDNPEFAALTGLAA
jgi:hypothetical protein